MRVLMSVIGVVAIPMASLGQLFNVMTLGESSILLVVAVFCCCFGTIGD